MKTNSFLRDLVFYSIMIGIVVVMMIVKTSSKEVMIAVHIKGEVNAPGYYELEEGSCLNDAIEMAGGITRDADINSVNLAGALVGGEEIIIPSASDKDEDIVLSNEQQTMDSNLYDDYSDSEDNDKSKESTTSTVVNINTASESELCKLDGIGSSTAAKIIKYRTDNNGFKSIDELKNVKGIGEGKFSEIKDRITV